MKDTVGMDNYGNSQSLIYCTNQPGKYKVGAAILAFPLMFAILANSLVVGYLCYICDIFISTRNISLTGLFPCKGAVTSYG